MFFSVINKSIHRILRYFVILFLITPSYILLIGFFPLLLLLNNSNIFENYISYLILDYDRECYSTESKNL